MQQTVPRNVPSELKAGELKAGELKAGELKAGRLPVCDTVAPEGRDATDVSGPSANFGYDSA
jgi:hypothetical protein